MPERTGVELLRDVCEADAALPFIMLTETGNEVAASEATSAGVTDYVIQKPIVNQHALLARKIVSQVERRRMEKAPLARTGETIDELTTVDFADVVKASGSNVETTRTTLDVVNSARIRCDPSRLKEVIENLLRNAVEHNKQSVQITAGVRPERTGVYVEDDGTGIPASKRERIFESGYTTLNRGTGFGLAIVGEIVDAHGWSIRVQDANSGGARFEMIGVEFVD